METDTIYSRLYPMEIGRAWIEAAYMRSRGVDVDFAMVKGNHYQYARERLEMDLEKTL